MDGCFSRSVLNARVATTAGIQAGEGRLYMCAFKDVCSNRIEGYAIDRRMKASLAVRALKNAMEQRSYPEDVIVHSDYAEENTKPRIGVLVWSGGVLSA